MNQETDEPKRATGPKCDCPLVQRLPIKFAADERWVVTRPFFPGGENRVRNLVQRVFEFTDSQVSTLLAQVQADFYSRHKDMDSVLREHYQQAAAVLGDLDPASDPRQLLIGAYRKSRGFA